jgi:glycogen debranching enzyme
MEKEQCFSPVLDSGGKAIPIVTNESAIGLFTGALYPEYAKKAAVRMTEDDLLTEWGTRTRSSDDPHFRANGTSSYHRGTVWPQIDTMFGLGCDQYGLSDISNQIKNRTASLVSKPGFGCIELFSVSPSGELDYYREDGKRVACFSQSWVIHGVLGITAPVEDSLPLAA